MAPGLLQRWLWKALGKEAGGDWTGMTSNQLSSQLGFTFGGSCGVTQGEGRWDVCWNLSQGAWDLVLHWEPVVPLRPPCTAGKSETAGSNARNPSSVPWATRP